MKTQLDERQELINKIEVLRVCDVRALKVFVAGMDAGKTLRSSTKESSKGKGAGWGIVK